MEVTSFAVGDHVEMDAYRGVAANIVRWCDQYRLDEYGDETDDCLHGECAIVVMVGDDVGHHCQLDELKKVSRDEFCGECGQIGCGHA